MSVESWTERGGAGAKTPAEPPRPHPAAQAPGGRLKVQLGPADVALQLWRSKWLMFLVFALFTVAAVGVALAFPTKYAAQTRVLVTLGQEYVFDPVVGEAARGAFAQPEEMLQAESELALSPVIAERVIAQFGLQKLYPRLSMEKAVEAYGKDMSAGAAPKSSIMRLSYKHEDPKLAAEVLNAHVAAYIAYRREVLMGREGQGLSVQRGSTEGRLKQADEALQAYLSQAGIADFEAEKAAVTKLYGTISDDLSTVDAGLREAEGRAAGLNRQMNATPREIDLYTESTSEQELMKLKLEREQLLTRYTPGSRAVTELDRRIAQMEAFLASRPAAGLRRIGPNPTYQALEADYAAARASVDALQQRSAELRRQKAEIEQRRARLAVLEPEVERLTRERDALEAAAKTLATREQTERARSELAAARADNISVYEPARAPTQGESPKRLVVVAGALLGLATALMLGLMRAWRASAFPTPQSLERTLGLRTLASVRAA